MTRETMVHLAWGAGILVLALGATLAHKLGYIDPDMVTRLVVGVNGLMIAWMGNRMPKTFVPNAKARQARRVAGWSLALSGLVYSGLFIWAPIRVAALGGAAAVIAGIAVTLAYCLTLQRRANGV